MSANPQPSVTPRPAVPQPRSGATVPATVRSIAAPARQVDASRPPPPDSARRAPAPARKQPDDRLALLLLLLVPLGITLAGLPYYLLDEGDRLRSPLRLLLKPSGVVGLTLGVLGFALFLFMWLYPMRKKFKWLAWTGSVPAWMRVHTVSGLALPVLVAVHAGWRFDGLIGLGYWAMVLVSLSGIVGRYLYVHIPRSQSGLEMTLDEVTNERRAIVTRIAAATGELPDAVERALQLTPGTGAVAREGGFLRLVTGDIARWRAARTLRREWSRPRPGRRALDRRALAEVVRLAHREMALAHQVRLLGATRRFFSLWHVAHRPVAITALLAVMIHVVVAVLFGAVGIR